MAEPFFSLSREDRSEALEFVRARLGLPAHLLEKDVWVVWVLRTLFESDLAEDLTFKGGTSLSKAYRIIDRFSEDLDLTCDIRKLLPDLVGSSGEIPGSRSQTQKYLHAIRDRLSGWILGRVVPILETALSREKIDAEVEVVGDLKDKIFLRYSPLAQGTGYVAPLVTLEFGGRATGEPHQKLSVVCDMDGHLAGVSFPTALPQVLSLSRTFWEKATAAHVYCVQGRLRGERYARHWHDLAAIASSPHLSGILIDRVVAEAVAAHKACFFIEKDATGTMVDYAGAVRGGLRIVPTGLALKALAEDYEAMAADGVMLRNGLPFDQLMRACASLEVKANQAAEMQP